MLLYSNIQVKQTYYNIHIKVNLSLCLINHHAMWGSRNTVSVFNFQQQMEWSSQLHVLSILPKGKSLKPLGMRLHGPQSQCRHNGEQKMLHPHCESKFQLFGYLACSLVTTLTELLWLSLIQSEMDN